MSRAEGTIGALSCDVISSPPRARSRGYLQVADNNTVTVYSLLNNNNNCIFAYVRGGVGGVGGNVVVVVPRSGVIRGNKRSHKESRVVPYSPEQFFAVVADVDNYKKFVPFCVGSKVVRVIDAETMEADMSVGFKVRQQTDRQSTRPRSRCSQFGETLVCCVIEIEITSIRERERDNNNKKCVL